MAVIDSSPTTGRATLDSGGPVTSVLIIDAHVMVAEGLGVALDAVDDIAVCGVAHSFDAGLARVLRAAPEVIVLDARLPDVETADAVRALLVGAPTAHIIVLGAAADYQAVMQALEAGASGYLLKGQRLSELADAVRTVHAGGRALAADLVNTLVDRLSSPSNRRYHLTARELDVLGRLADGASTIAVSQQLDLSVNTVRNHVQSALRRLGAQSQLEAISIARREGLIASH